MKNEYLNEKAKLNQMLDKEGLAYRFKDREDNVFSFVRLENGGFPLFRGPGGDTHVFSLKGCEVLERHIPLYEELAKALVFWDREYLDMGDNYAEPVDYFCSLAGIPFYIEKDLFEQAGEAYQILAEKKPMEIIDTITILLTEFDYVERLKHQLKFHSEIFHEVHPTIDVLRDIYSYLNEMVSAGLYDGSLIPKMESVISEFMEIDLEAIRVGASFGDTYFRHLDPEFFGVVSNTAYCVGGVITDKRGLPEGNYIYEAHAEYNRLNTPCNGYGIFFRRKDTDGIFADIFFYTRNGVESAVYQKLCFSVPITLESVEEKSLKISDMLNWLAYEDLAVSKSLLAFAKDLSYEKWQNKSEEIGFDYCNQWITYPFIDPSGRFEFGNMLDMVDCYGYQNIKVFLARLFESMGEPLTRAMLHEKYGISRLMSEEKLHMRLTPEEATSYEKCLQACQKAFDECWNDDDSGNVE